MSFRACQYQQSIIIILQILFADYHKKKFNYYQPVLSSFFKVGLPISYKITIS